MFVDHRAIFFLKNFQEKFIVVDWVFVVEELAVRHKVLPIYSVVSFGVWTESAYIEAFNARGDLATKSRFVSIDWVECDGGILNFPKAAKSALHITSRCTTVLVFNRHLHHVKSVLVLVATPGVLYTFTSACLVVACELAS